MKKQALYGALATVVALSMTVVGASAANAAQTRTLPTGESLYSYSNDTDAMVGTYDVATGDISLVANPTTHVGQERSGGYNWNTKTAYAWTNAGTLVSYDAAGGQTEFPQDLIDVSGEPNWDPSSGATSSIRSGRSVVDEDGNAFVHGYVVYYDTSSNENNVWYVWPLDLTDGTVGVGVPSDFTYPDAFVYNPADDTYYMMDGASNGSDLYSYDVTTGVSTYVSTPDTTTKKYWFNGVTVDSNGIAWATDTYWEDASNGSVWGEPCLCSFSFAEYAAAGDVQCADSATTYNGTEIYAGTVWVTWDFTPKAPELPNTGVDISTLAVTVSVLLSAGLALVIVRRRSFE